MHQNKHKGKPFEKPCDRCEYRGPKVPEKCSKCERFKQWFRGEMIRAQRKAQADMKGKGVKWAVAEAKQ